MELLSFFKTGGFIMYPLLIYSILLWSVVFEKLWVLNNFKRKFNDIHDHASQLLKDKRINELKGLLLSAGDLIGPPHLALFDEAISDFNVREERVARRLVETQIGLKRFLWILGTISSTAPFIGLFGTVVGIIKSFDNISQTGKSGFSVVAGSLSEALVATAAGIIVAVIALIFYNYFINRLNIINTEVKNKVKDLSDLIEKK